MKARPILFSGPMIRTLLDGKKTQTRRIAKLADSGRVKAIGSPQNWHIGDPDVVLACPYGQLADFLWVRECHSFEHDYNTGETFHEQHDPVHFWADGNPEYGDWTRPKPSIHMPRWASRLTLRITEVRVQRLQDISEADARAEGASQMYEDDLGQTFKSHRRGFQSLWESINGAGSWDADPWVWAISFNVIKANVDDVLRQLQEAA